MTRTRAWLGVVGLLAAFLVVGILLLAVNRELPKTVILADGTVLQIEEVVYGKRGTIRLERGFERLKQDIARQLPKKLGDRLATPPAALKTIWQNPTTVNTNRDALHVWFTHRDGAGKYLAASYAAAIIVDEHGCVFETSQQGGLDDGRLGTLYWAASNTLYSLPRSIANWFRFDAFPRGEKLLAIKFIEQDTNSANPGAQWRAAADFAVSNPRKQTARDAGWQTESLPISRTFNDGTLIFEGLRIAHQVKWDFGTDFQFSAVTKFKPKSPDVQPWIYTDIILSDGSGNQTSLRRGTLTGLCLKEPAWKLTGKFVCPSDPDGTLNVCWTIPKVEVPVRSGYTLLGQSHSFGGTYVKAIALGGPGRTVYSNEMIVRTSVRGDDRNAITPSPPLMTVDCVNAHLALVVADLGTDERLSVLAIDEQGRRINGQLISTGEVDATVSTTRARSPYLNFSGGRETRFVELNLPEDSKAVDLLVTVHHARTVEFVFKPPSPDNVNAGTLSTGEGIK